MRRGRGRKQICMEATLSSEAGRGDKRGLGEPGSVLGSQKATVLGDLHHGLGSAPPHSSYTGIR